MSAAPTGTKAAKRHIHDLLVGLLQSDDQTQQDQITLRLMLDSPDPDILDYIYHSTEFYDEDGVLDLDAVVDMAFQT